MSLFPTDFAATTPDRDDVFLLDGRRKATGAGVKIWALPAGHVDVNDFTAPTTALVNAADSLTGWTTVNQWSATALDTTTKTQGTASVSSMLRNSLGGASKLYYTPPGTQSITGRSLVAFDTRWFADGPTHASQHEYEARVADGAALAAGNIVSLNLSGVPYGAWVTIVLPLTGLANIASVGVMRTVTTVGDSTWRVGIRIDNVRFLDETKLDAALGAYADTVAFVPPGYTPDANQLPLHLGAGKGIIDAAKGVFSKQNNVVWLHDSLAHVVGAETGEVNVGPDINRIINQADPGQTIRATPGAIYRFDSDVVLRSLRDLTVDFTGATIFLTYQTNTPFWSFVLCRNITVIGGTWLGYYKVPVGGSAMTTVVGTPTNSGFTKLLDASLEEVRLPNHTNWARPSHFARHLPQQLGLPDDGEGPRCYWEFILSDSAQVADDCTISVYDATDGTWDDTNGDLLTSTTVTLTATPTVYRISHTPTNLRKRHKVSVRKETATANTITVTQAIPYGENEYSSTYDIASCFLLQYSSYIKILDTWVEGFGGDAVQVSDQSVNNVEYRNSYSRACRRQGASFNQGTEFLIEDCVFAETGRSGLDFEPFAVDWYTQRVTCRNLTFCNTVNYAFAMGNWARNFDYVIDGVEMYETRLGVIYGGFNRGVIANMRNWSALNYGASQDYEFIGSNMTIRNVRTKVEVVLRTTTNTWDDGTGSAVFTPANNAVDSRSVTVVSGSGITWATGYRDLNAELHLAANTGAAYTATRTALRQDFLLTLTANATITLAGGNLLNNELSTWNIVFKQDATGGRTLAVTGVVWVGGTPSFTTTALASNHCTFTQHGNGTIYGRYHGTAAS